MRALRPSRRTGIAGIAGAGAVIAAATQLASAGVSVQTMDPTATLSRDGRTVRVTGPIGCNQVERIKIVTRVTQRETAAHGVGTSEAACPTGTAGRWSATVKATGRYRFVPGEAEGVALAITRKGGRRTDAHQWLKALTLVRR